MRNIALFTVVGAVCFVAAAQAQPVAQADGLKIEQTHVQHTDSSLHVDFTVNYTGLHLSTQEQLAVQPIFVAGRDTAYMPYLLLAGKTRDKMNHRRAAINGTKGSQEQANLYRSVRVERNGQPQVIKYTASVPFREWMPGARLELMQTLSGCADCRQKLPSLLIGSVAEAPAEASPRAAFPEPGVETVKMKEERGEAFLNFLQGQSVIRPGLDGNTPGLQKINQTIEQVLNDKNVSCQSIHLKGYASPEGAYAFNTRLSRARAEALENYIQKKYPHIDCSCTVEAGSEDWEGLHGWLLSSSIPYKEQVLEIITRVNDPDAREAKIRQLDGGKVYNRLLKEAYPSLRKVVYTIRYHAAPSSVEEGKR